MSRFYSTPNNRCSRVYSEAIALTNVRLGVAASAETYTRYRETRTRWHKLT
jgi:hypothetical protein